MTATKKYDNIGTGWYFSFDRDSNKVDYKYILSIKINFNGPVEYIQPDILQIFVAFQQ